MCKDGNMSERFEQATPPLGSSLRSEEGAMVEADALREKIKTGEATTYVEAEYVLARNKFQKKLEQHAEAHDTRRPKWKKWLGISKANPAVIGMELAEREDLLIASLVKSGTVKDTVEAIEYLERKKSFPAKSPKELDLEYREFSSAGLLLGGNMGSATFVELKDDGSAVYKPYDGQDVKRRIESIRKERAAYLIDSFLGFNFVPPTIIRELDKGIGSFQEFVADAKVGYEARQNEKPDEEIHKLRLFDAIILNGDRHEGNYLVKEKKVYAIDHGNTLPLERLGIQSHHLDELSDKHPLPLELRTGLQRFAEWPESQELLRDALTELFGEKCGGALMKRISLFLAAIDGEGNFCKEQFKKGIDSSQAELCPT